MEQQKVISCCGIVCSDCTYYPADCPGCPKTEGKIFWTQYLHIEVCPLYQCCVAERSQAHCGTCAEFPCRKFYEGEDPTRSKEENEADNERRIGLLRELAGR